MFNEQVLKTLLNNTPIGYAYFDISTNESGFLFSFSDMNPAFSKITNINKEVIGRSLDELSNHYELVQMISDLLNSIASVGEDGDASKYFISSEKYLYVHCFTANAFGAVAQIIDRTEEEQLKNELTIKAEEFRYLSYHDKLTGLYNRAFFEEEVKRLDDDRNLPISIIMGDTNGLKLINDVFGHTAGDNMIKATATLLSNSCRKSDIIARWGGDEFIILLPKTPSKNTSEIINRIKSNFKMDKFDIDYLNLSLGYSVKELSSTPISKTIKEAEDNMYKNKSIEGKLVRNIIVSSIVNHLYGGNIEVKLHMDRLKVYALEIATFLKLSEEDLNKLNKICEVHDIGNISVDKNILFKSGILSDEDWDAIKKHPETGYRIAKSIPELSDIANYILHHHERWDGTGYPHKIKGENIPLLSRLFSVVDTFDAMTQDKQYRKAYSRKDAIQYIKDNSGTQFDPNIVDAFLKVIK